MMKFNYKNKNNLLILALFSVLGLNATWNFTSSNKLDFASTLQIPIDRPGSEDMLIQATVEKDGENSTVKFEAYYQTEGGLPKLCKECLTVERPLLGKFDSKNKQQLNDMITKTAKEIVKDEEIFDKDKKVESEKERNKDNDKKVAKKNDDSDPIMKKCESQFQKDGTTETLSGNSFITCAIDELGRLSQKDDKKAKYSITKLYDEYIKDKLHAGFSNKDDSAEISRAKEMANNLLEKVDKKYKSSIWADVNKLITQNIKDETKLAARESAKEYKEAAKDEAKARAEGDYFALQDALDRKRELITNFQDGFMGNYEPYHDAIFSHVGESGFSNSTALDYVRSGLGRQLDFDPRYADVPSMMDNWAMKTLTGNYSRGDLGGSGYNSRLARNGLQGSSDRLLGNQGYRGIGGGGQLRLNGSPNLSSSFNGGSDIWTPSNLGGRNFGPMNNGPVNYGPNNIGPNNNFPYSTGSFAGSGSFLGPQNGPQPRFSGPQFGGGGYQNFGPMNYNQNNPSFQNRNIFMNSGGGTGLRSRY